MQEQVEFVLSQPYFSNKYSESNCATIGVEPPIKSSWERTKSQTYIITGDNASGKSFFVNMLRSRLIELEVPLMHTGMVHRCASYAERFSEHYFSLVPEEIASTGENSIALLFQIIQSSYKQPKDHMILLDEPALGISEDYHCALGDYLQKHIEQSRGTTVIVEHSKKILEKLAQTKPNHLRFGDTQSLEEVIKGRKRSQAELQELPKRSILLREQIASIEKKIKEKNKVTLSSSTS